MSAPPNPRPAVRRPPVARAAAQQPSSPWTAVSVGWDSPPNMDSVPAAQLPDDICGICQDNFEDPYKTACGHIYCKQCIMSWILTQIPPNDSSFLTRVSCPICRQVFFLATFDGPFFLNFLHVGVLLRNSGLLQNNLATRGSDAHMRTRRANWWRGEVKSALDYILRGGPHLADAPCHFDFRLAQVDAMVMGGMLRTAYRLANPSHLFEDREWDVVVHLLLDYLCLLGRTHATTPRNMTYLNLKRQLWNAFWKYSHAALFTLGYYLDNNNRLVRDDDTTAVRTNDFIPSEEYLDARPWTLHEPPNDDPFSWLIFYIASRAVQRHLDAWMLNSFDFQESQAMAQQSAGLMLCVRHWFSPASAAQPQPDAGGEARPEGGEHEHSDEESQHTDEEPQPADEDVQSDSDGQPQPADSQQARPDSSQDSGGDEMQY